MFLLFFVLKIYMINILLLFFHSWTHNRWGFYLKCLFYLYFIGMAGRLGESFWEVRWISDSAGKIQKWSTLCASSSSPDQVSYDTENWPEKFDGEKVFKIVDDLKIESDGIQTD